MEAVRWKINLLGKLSAQRGERTVTNFRTGKTALLLACLAQEPNRAVRREDLVERLWPDQSAEVAQNRLRVVLSYLRDILEPDPQDRGRILLADRREVRLAPGYLTTDTVEFEANLLRADRLKDDEERVAAFESAVEQYRAEFLPEFDEFWVTTERLRLADAYQLALRRLIQALMNLRKHDRALEVALKAVQADPFREETHRLVMLVYAKMGRPTAALQQYEELERLLQDRMGSAPSSETQDTLTKVCGPRHTPARGPVESPRVPERARTTSSAPPAPQKRPARRPAEPKAPLALAMPRLPAPLTPLIGREDAVTQVLAMLETPETRLVNLIGVAGVGKTRLALAAAEQVRDRGETVCFLALAGLQDAAEIAARLAAALHLPLRPPADLWERLVEALSAEPMLLVLDNVEHLLPGASPIVRRLLEEVPGLTCLATSRQRLAMAGEYPFAVRPLATPAPSEDPDEVAQSLSVRLWLDRVRATSPDFQLTRSNCRDVVSLCRTLEGIPLALELAAAWADMLAPKQVATRLSARFSVLVGRDERFEGRHASLLAALDWSYDLLAPHLRRLFARLGRFRCGWTLEAAEAICREPEALKYLAQLVERSLVTTQETEEGMRYGFLETVREYALTHLDEDDLAETNRLYVDYFLGLAEEAAPALICSDSPVWMHRLRAEEENFGTALSLGMQDTARLELPLRMSVALYRYWYTDGAVREGRRHLASALSLVPPDSPLRPKALTALGNLAYAERDMPAAEQYYTECKDIYDRSGETRGVAGILCNLANVRRCMGDFPQARALALEGLEIMRRLSDTRGQALALGNLALIADKSGGHEAALHYGAQALTQFRLLGDWQNLITGLTNMSVAALHLGRHEESAALLAECLELCLRLGARRQLAIVVEHTGILSMSMGMNVAAINLMAAGGEMWRRLEIPTPQESEERLDRDLAAIRRILGDPTVRREWDNGLQLTEQAAFDLAQTCLRSAA